MSVPNPFAGIPFQWDNPEPETFRFLFDVSNHRVFRTYAGVQTAMLACAMTYPRIDTWDISFPSPVRLLLVIKRKP